MSIKDAKVGNRLPWFAFFTANFKSKTDHLSNAAVGAFMRLQVSYWDNNGLPFDERALKRIAKIEPADDVDLSELLGEFFELKDGSIRHEELDALRVAATKEEEAKRRRTLPARIALAAQRGPVAASVTETEVEQEVDAEVEQEQEQEARAREQEREEQANEDSDQKPQANGRARGKTDTHTRESHPQVHEHGDPDGQEHRLADMADAAAGDSGSQPDGQVSRAPDGSAPGADRALSGAAIPKGTGQQAQGPSATGSPTTTSRTAAASSAHLGISFRLKDGSLAPIPAVVDQSRLSRSQIAALRQRSEMLESKPLLRFGPEMLPQLVNRWLEQAAEAA